MDRLTQFFEENRGLFRFVSLREAQLTVKTDFSFGSLYAECTLDNACGDTREISGCRNIEFTNDGRVRFLSDRDRGAAGAEVRAEEYSYSDLCLKLVFTDYTSDFCLADFEGKASVKPWELLRNASRTLSLKSETVPEMLTAAENALLPRCNAYRFLYQTANGIDNTPIRDNFGKSFMPVIDGLEDRAFAEGFLAVNGKPSTKDRKKLKKSFDSWFRSDSGHRFVSALMSDISDASAPFRPCRHSDVRRAVTEKLKEKGYSGAYPYFSRQSGEKIYYIAMCENGDENTNASAVLHCAAARLDKNGTVAGVKPSESRLFDAEFCDGYADISLETLDYENEDLSLITDSLSVADMMFEGKKLSSDFVRRHSGLFQEYRRGKAQSLWVGLLSYIVFGLLFSLIITCLVAFISIGITALVGLARHDSGLVGWFITVRGKWSDVGILSFLLCGGFSCAYILRGMNRPLYIKPRGKKNGNSKKSKRTGRRNG